jgi:hypothetical protein
MMVAPQTESVTRGNILRLLTDEELAQVSIGETTVGLVDGDEYLDLEHPSYGVQRASGAVATMSGVLPRKLVAASTWGRILKRLEPPPREPPVDRRD